MADFSSVLVVAITRAPITFLATWMAAVPTPAEADSTSTVSQGRNRSFRMSMFQTGKKVVGTAAACS